MLVSVSVYLQYQLAVSFRLTLALTLLWLRDANWLNSIAVFEVAG